MSILTTDLPPILGFFILTLVFYLSPLFFLGLTIGPWPLRLLLVLIYLYQLILCSKSPLFIRFLSFLRPHDYFPSNGTIFSEISPFIHEKNMVALHPHGVMATLLPLNQNRSKHFKSFHFLATSVLGYIPLGGIIAKWLGIESVDPLNFERLLAKGENIAFLPGGFEEATITDDKQDKVFINKRKGFIKYGLKYGYNLYPCYSFNENRIFKCLTRFEGFRLWWNRFKIPGVIFWGKFGLLPRRDIKMYTVVGDRIELPKLETITKEDVEKYHQIYIEKLREIYDKYKEKFDCCDKLMVY